MTLSIMLSKALGGKMDYSRWLRACFVQKRQFYGHIDHSSTRLIVHLLVQPWLSSYCFVWFLLVYLKSYVICAETGALKFFIWLTGVTVFCMSHWMWDELTGTCDDVLRQDRYLFHFVRRNKQWVSNLTNY